MDWFYLQPFSLLALTQAIVAGFITLYLLQIKNKTRATWMLVLTFGAFGLFWGIRFIDFSESGLAPLPFFLGPLDNMVIPIALLGFLNFAYAFLDNPFPRESKFLLILTVVVIGIVLYHGYRIATRAFIPPAGEIIIEINHLIMMFWTISVFVRKKLRLTTEGDLLHRLLHAKSHDERALRAFGLFSLVMIFFPIRTIWLTLGYTPLWLEYIEYIGYMVLIITFVVIYINHTREPTTFLVKLVGLSLTTLLVVLGLAAMTLFPDAELTLNPGTEAGYTDRTWVRELQSLRFVPNQVGGYNVGAAPLRFDPELGRNLGLTVEGDSLMSLNFAFPFYGASWDSMYIDSNGLVSFGSPYLHTSLQDFITDENPKIAPYYRALIPVTSEGSGVYFKSDSSRTTVTWYRIRERYDERPDNQNTFQLVLHPNGNIDFIYDQMDAIPLYGFRGLRPGGTDIAWEPEGFTFEFPHTFKDVLVPEHQTIRFEPDASGTYQTSTLPAEIELEQGDLLHLTDQGEAAIALDFSFPFFGASWDSLIVNANGIISFGQSMYPPGVSFFTPFHPSYAERPIIAPFFTDLNPSENGAIYYDHNLEQATITWDQVPVFGTGYLNTVQLALHRSGRVDFTYGPIGIPEFAADLWGLYPGDGRPPVDAVRYINERPSFAGSSDAGLVENLNIRRGLSFLQYRHERMVPFFAVILGSTLFVLLIFPFLFRVTLIHPLDALLEGVRRVNTGDLDARVPVRVNDELGLLAQNFNRMTASLKQAEDQLRAYAEGLEEKVAERTAELEQALQHLKEAQTRLIHAEKMASLGQMTAGIAHEIKNPLNFVNNFAQMSVELADELKEALDEGQPIDEILDDLVQNATLIKGHGERASNIVESMMRHTPVKTGRRERTDLNRLVQDQIQRTMHIKRDQLQNQEVVINQDFDPEIGYIEVIPQEIGRVLLNLLSNALDAVLEKAQSADSDYELTIHVQTERFDDVVKVRITDNGPGIPTGYREKIFEPFFTTKPTGTGTGLGLSMSYDIVTHGHGGSLTVESEDGNGATFVVTLPRG